MRSVEEIEAELRAARMKERLELEEKQKAVKPIYTFTLIQSTLGYDTKEVFDSSCVLYILSGTVTNKEELIAVHKIPFEGSMRYLFNTLSGKFVMAVSGGSIFISDPLCFTQLSKFVQEYPGGGDVTTIVNLYREGK
jgi:hypothetical protein